MRRGGDENGKEDEMWRMMMRDEVFILSICRTLCCLCAKYGTITFPLVI